MIEGIIINRQLDKFCFFLTTKIIIFPINYIHYLLVINHPVVPIISINKFLYGLTKFNRDEGYKMFIYYLKCSFLKFLYFTFLLNYDDFLIYYLRLLNKHSYHSKSIHEYILFVRKHMYIFNNQKYIIINKKNVIICLVHICIFLIIKNIIPIIKNIFSIIKNNIFNKKIYPILNLIKIK